MSLLPNPDHTVQWQVWTDDESLLGTFFTLARAKGAGNMYGQAYASYTDALSWKPVNVPNGTNTGTLYSFLRLQKSDKETGQLVDLPCTIVGVVNSGNFAVIP